MPEEAAQATQTDALLRTWDAHWEKRRTDDPHRKRHTFRFQSTLELVPGEPRTIVDIGGGHGNFASLARERFPRCDITVVDRSKAAVTIASERGFRAREADISTTLPFPDRSFECAVCMDVLEHLVDPWPVIAEMARISSVAVIVACPNFASASNRWDVLNGNPPRAMSRYRDHISFITFRDMQRRMQELGLRTGDYRTQVKVPRRLRRLPVWRLAKPAFFHRVAPTLCTTFTILACHASERRESQVSDT